MYEHVALAHPPLCQQVTFVNNKGPKGALYLVAGAEATMTGGKTYFRSNTATAGSAAGGMTLEAGSSLNIDAPLCAQNNSGQEAGFWYASSGGTVRFSQPETANVAGNSPSDMVLLGGNVFCGDSTTSWRRLGSYNVTGNVCACNDAFSNSSRISSCNSCTLGWSAEACSCKVSYLQCVRNHTLLSN